MKHTQAHTPYATTRLSNDFRRLGHTLECTDIDIGTLARLILCYFFLSLWIYLWLAETSQQPICQTTWLKVTPHCNHCIH
jgi:hypothetical protein